MANANSWRCTRFAAWFTDIRTGNQPYYYVIDSNTTGNYINSFPAWWLGPVTIYFAALGGGALPGEGEVHRSSMFYTTNRFFRGGQCIAVDVGLECDALLGSSPNPANAGAVTNAHGDSNPDQYAHANTD